MDFFMIDSYRQEIEIKSGGRNTVIYDDYGNPNIMVCLPRRNFEDYGFENTAGIFPAFNVEGKEVSEIWISKYPNTVSNGGVPCSLPDTWRTIMKSPKEIKEKCLKKGLGWHQLTNLEYMAITFGVIRSRVVGGLGYETDANSEMPPELSDDPDKRFDRNGSGPRGYYTFDYNGIYEMYGGSREFADGVRFSPLLLTVHAHGTDDHTLMNRPFSDKYICTGYEYDIQQDPPLLDQADSSGYNSFSGIRYVDLAKAGKSIESDAWQNTEEGLDVLRALGMWTLPNMKVIDGVNKLELSCDYKYMYKDRDQYNEALRNPDISSLYIAERGGWYNESTKQGEMLGMVSASFTHPIDYKNQPYAGAARACYVTYTGKYKD